MRSDDIEGRALQLRNGRDGGKCVNYWMSREQRGQDNEALDHACGIADRLGLPVLAFFALAPSYSGAARRHFDFMLTGLKEVEVALSSKGIGFRLLVGEPERTVPDLVSELSPAAIVLDFDPLRT